jgi:hypothetical protein
VTAAWVASLTAVAVAVVGLGSWGGRWAVRLLIGTHEFLVDWPKMKTAIADLRSEVAEVKAETRPNGGSSMRDVVHRIDEAVAEIKSEQAKVRVRLEVFDAKHTGGEKT